MSDVYEITHSSFELKTVGDFIFAPGSPASRYINKEKEFLAVKNKEGITNKEAIISRFKSKRKLEEIASLPLKQIPIKVGTKLAIPVSKIDRVGLLTDGIQVVDNNVPVFKAKALAELEANENYNPVRKLKSRSKISGELSETYPEITVWIWCRALSNTQLSDEVDFNKGEIFNITPFIQRLTTSNSKGGGNFSFTLPPLACEFDEKRDKWIIKKTGYAKYRGDSKNSTQQGDGFYSESILVYEKDNELRRSQFLFHNIISPNDLVFIRFETLNLEKDQRIEDNEDFIIHKSKLPGRIYDMIGLVDVNSQNVDATNGDVTIQIDGRDLSKLFIDDGTYFYALEMAQGQLNFAGGSQQENEYMQRVFMDSSLQYFNLYFNNSIENTFKFVIQQLSSIKIVPDDLFEYYGDRRNTRWSNLVTKKERSAEINKKLKSFKKKGEEAIRKIREEKGLKMTSSSIETEKIEEVWRKCLHFFKSERDRSDEGRGNEQEYLYTSKRGTEKILKGNLPLFASEDLDVKTKAELDQGLTTALTSYIDIDKTHPDFDEKTSIGPAKGIWQIVKLVIDESVTERRVVDSSASSANGSLINFLKKVCQEPFVEFYTDTYGDMFHLIVRKPPINREGLISMLDGDVTVENQEGDKEVYKSTIIDIETSDVLQEQLAYNEQDIYSWYHLNPQSNFLGQGNTYSLAYLPAIFFKEYAEIWGSKPLNITHNYMPKLPLNNNKSTLDVSEMQAFNDLAFLVESFIYMPFTRKGTIIVNGDRRLKVGNICRYKPTGEIFFIDGVRQSFSIQDNSIDRTTTIEVSRGMVEDLILGTATTEKNTGDPGEDVSYFKILKDTELQFKKKTVIDRTTERVKTGKQKVKRKRLVSVPVDSAVKKEDKGKKEEKNKTTKQKQPALEPVSGGGFLDTVKRGYREVKGSIFGYNEAREAFKKKIGISESGGQMFTKHGKLIENGGKGQTAKGKYQIIDATWNSMAKKFYAKYKRAPGRASLHDNEIIMDLILDEYERMLKAAGLEVTGTHFYALHLKGNTRWIKAAYQNPNASVATQFNTSEIKHNPTFMRGGTLGYVINTLAKKMSEPVQFKQSELSSKSQGFSGSGGSSSSTELVEVEEWVYEDVYEDRVKETPRVTIQRELVFEKFVINKESFNYFLKRRQNNPNVLGKTNRIEVVDLTSKKLRKTKK